jgi:hypothetical protein
MYYLHPNHLHPFDSSPCRLGQELCHGFLSDSEETARKKTASQQTCTDQTYVTRKRRLGIALTQLGCSHPFVDAAQWRFAADGADHSSPWSRSSCPWWPPKPEENYKMLPKEQQYDNTLNRQSLQHNMNPSTLNRSTIWHL